MEKESENENRNRIRVTWKMLFVNMLGAAINFDSRFIATFTGLLLHPGKTMREAVDEGNYNNKYSNPMQFIFFTGVFCLVAYLIFPEPNPLVYIPADPENIWQKLFAQFANNYILYTCVSILLFNFIPFYIAFGLSKMGRTRNMPQLYMYLLYQQGLIFFFEAIVAPFNIIDFSWWWLLISLLLVLAQLFFTIRMDIQFFKIRFFNSTLRYLLQFILTLFFIWAFLSPIWFGTKSSTDKNSKEFRNMMGFIARKQIGDWDIVRQLGVLIFYGESDETYYDSWFYQPPASYVIGQIINDLAEKDSTYGIDYKYVVVGDRVIYTEIISKDSASQQSSLYIFMKECYESQLVDTDVVDEIKALRYRMLFLSNAKDIPKFTQIYHHVLKDSLQYEEHYVEKDGLMSLTVKYTLDEVEAMLYYSRMSWLAMDSVGVSVSTSDLPVEYWYIGKWIDDDTLFYCGMDAVDGDENIPHYFVKSASNTDYGWVKYDEMSGYYLESMGGAIYQIVPRGNNSFYLYIDDTTRLHFSRFF